MNPVPEHSDEPLDELAKAAREAMLRTSTGQAGPRPCPPGRAAIAFVADLVIGIGCYCTAAYFLTVLFEDGVLPRSHGIVDCAMMVTAASSPLAYSVLDCVVGGTPGKLLAGVLVIGPSPLRRALIRRWAVKGAPLIASALFGILGLVNAMRRASASPSASPSDLWSWPAALTAVLGYLWWLIASGVDRNGQTLADWIAGTKLVLRDTRPRPEGFEPLPASSGPAS
jgi:uncharacterized RDD family membrane protein YckC